MALAVSLFAAHPLRTEVVAWVSCQPYLPWALFSMLMVLTYRRGHAEGRPARVGWAIAAFLLFVAALLSKAVAAPPLLIFDIYPLRRLEGNHSLRRFGSGPAGRWAWIEKLPYVTLSLEFIRLAALAKSAENLGSALLRQGKLDEVARQFRSDPRAQARQQRFPEQPGDCPRAPREPRRRCGARDRM